MKHTVMVIEDEEALALLLKYNLEKEGYDVVIESRGNKALGEVEKIIRQSFCWIGCCRKCQGSTSAN